MMNRNIVVKRIQNSAPKPAMEVVSLVATKCQNAKYECSIAAEENQQYCIKHILQDASAPYKQCTHIYLNGKQCTQAKPIEEKNDSNYSTFCFEHSRLGQISKTKSTLGCFKQIETPETIVNSLAHHLKLDKVKPQSTTKNSPYDSDEEVDVVTPSVDPFTEIVALDVNNRGKNILDFASESSSDEDTPTTLSNTWRCYELDHSDVESVDSTEEDVLKHAGVYTVDEVATITKEKMQRLQTLYIDQFQRLQYVLREKRRQYLIELKKEKETLCSIHDQFKDSPKERKLYNNLKAMNRYHRRNGAEALLLRQYREKRQKQLEPSSLMSAPGIPVQKNIPKCTFSEGGVKCNEKSIPCCKFCRKHILEDKKQILFKACAIEKSGIVCQEPVVNIFDDSSCVLHTELPHPKTYIKRKYESETEEDEDGEPAIKNEAIEEVVEMDTTTNDEVITIVDDIKEELIVEQPTSTDVVVA